MRTRLHLTVALSVIARWLWHGDGPTNDPDAVEHPDRDDRASVADIAGPVRDDPADSEWLACHRC